MSPSVIALLAGTAAAGPHTLMVGVDGEVGPHRSALVSLGATRTRCYRRAGICVADLPGPAAVEAARQRVLSRPGVRYVEVDQPMPVAQLAFTGDHVGTADCFDLWELTAMDLEPVFAAGFTGVAAPVVAIQDTGFYESHVDFGAVSGRYDYGDWDATPEVVTSVGVPHHGTFIAGELNGVADNGRGRAGVVPDGRVNLQKIADSSGALYFSYAVSAMADLAEGDLGVRVLSYSIGGPSSSAAFSDAVDALGAADILLVAAAANCGVADCWDADNDSHPIYPASYSGGHILSVAGSTRDGSLNPYSHYGATSVDLAAPGVDICSLGIDSTTATLTAGGTSYATPLVAGAAALVFEAHPELSAAEVARVVRASARPHTDLEGKVRSGGNLDVAAAISTAVPRLEEPPETVRVDGTGSLALSLTNAGATGEATVVLTHPPELGATVAAEAPTGWSAAAFGPGDVLTLADAGTHTATGSGTVLTGPLAAHATAAVPVDLRAAADGEGTLTVRLIATSAGADYLNAPYLDGTADETGFLAYSSGVSFFAAEPADTGCAAEDCDSGEPEPEPEPEPDPDTAVEPDLETDGGTSGARDPADKGGCAVVSAAGGLGAGALAGLWAAGLRRRLTWRESPDAP